MAAGGPGLRSECRESGPCRAGEVKVTKGHSLPARLVAHTVGPRYNIKYRTAAESALFNCYRTTLQVLKEGNHRTLGLCAINSLRRAYPADAGAHIAIRCVRRFLEKFSDSVDSIVFCVQGSDKAVYDSLLPIYFPRSAAEEARVRPSVPLDIGNEDGEPVIAERNIRISEKVFGTEDDEEEDDDDEDDGDRLRKEFESQSFAKMATDHDQSRRETLSAVELDKIEQSRLRYQHWLRRARTEDLSSIAAHKMIYQSGVDSLGRPVVVFVGKFFPAQSLDLQKAMCYFMLVMDQIVNQDYVIVYFHTQTTSDNLPDTSFLKDFYHNVDHRYKKNLKHAYIVHPTFWCKVVTWFISTFTVSDIKRKIRHLDGVQFLFDTIRPDQIAIPPFILEFDRIENGVDYHHPGGGQGDVAGL